MTLTSTRPHGISRLWLRRSSAHWILYFSILAIGIFARTWEFQRLPPGLNADEASNGVDARSLLHFGTDRNNVPLPVKFISWGGGQDALYGYLLVPFVAVLGLTPTVVRLPMLLIGILSLPLFYSVADATFGGRLALLSMFLLAISPWHILLSRWALEANLFPFLFLAAYSCLLRVNKGGGWFLLTCVLLGLCLYAYGTAYAVVPVFFACIAALLCRERLVLPRFVIAGLLTFSVVAIPAGLLLLINTFGMSSIAVGPLTIPRFPVQARYEAATLIGSTTVLRTLAGNVWIAAKLLTTQSDGLLYNVIEPYGYFYAYSLPMALLGAVVLTRGLATAPRFEMILLASWLGAACLVPIFQAVNINRWNIIFMPLLLCTALGVQWLETRSTLALPAVVLVLLAGFAGFTRAYHGPVYGGQANWKFHAGLLPALHFARGVAVGPICVTDTITMPYIFALFSEETDPSAFVQTVRYADPAAPLRQATSFGRYVFGGKNCAGRSDFTYVLAADELPPRLGNRYQYEFFDNFAVYYPKP
jgi:hypothetical protein